MDPSSSQKQTSAKLELRPCQISNISTLFLCRYEENGRRMAWRSFDEESRQPLGILTIQVTISFANLTKKDLL